MPSTAAAFLHRIEQHLLATGTKSSEFGRAAVGDPTFVLALRRGRSPRLSTVDRVAAYLDAAEGKAAPADAGADR